MPDAFRKHGSKDDSFRESFLSLLDDTRDDMMAPEVFEGVPVACDYLEGMDMDGDGDMAATAAAAYSLDSAGPHAGVRSIEHVIASSPLVQRSIQQQEVGAPMAAFLLQLMPTSVLGQPGTLGIERVCPDGSALEASFCMRTSPDVGSFSCYRSTAAEELMSRDTKQQQITRLARTCSSCGSDPNKKKRSEGKVGGKAKKSKPETSDISSPKPQAPKVKLGEKITALQQIVSPFGKTDTASVLLETINYIKFLHEQIQLFSEPYMTNSTNKDHIHWGGEENRKAGLENDFEGQRALLGPCFVDPSVTLR
ncbi:hypothetical protein E2562_024223 [Oryza meyeriana var. granulata]|uniref:BHLH domain-containing protein n=1 Tax=Oryza meyeriana var. granulata TaxID=110450 RepID=A0A6G1BZR9_9ORYZ|nr:hypothetical protein E2562_024223 [Oryza meyeriana var. granulata]